MRPRDSSFLGATLTYGLSGSFIRLAGLAVVPVLTRTLSPADYGVSAAAASVIGLAAVLSTAGLDAASGRWFYDDESEDYRRRVIATWFWATTLFGLLIAPIVFGVAERWSDLHVSPQVSLLMASVVALASFTKVAGNTFRLQGRPREYLLFNTGAAILQACLCLGLVWWLHAGLQGYFIAQVAASLLAAVAAVVWLGPWLTYRNFSVTLLRSMARFSCAMLPIGLIAWIQTSSDRVLMGGILSLHQLAIYSVAATAVAPLGLAISSFRTAYGPFALSKGKNPEAPVLYARCFEAYLAVAVLVAILNVLVSPVIVRVIAPPAYAESVQYVPYLAAASVMAGLYDIAITGLNLAKRAWPICLASATGACITVVLDLLLLKQYGIAGAAVAQVAGATGSVLVALYLAKSAMFIPFGYAKGAFLCAIFGAAAVAYNIALTNWGINVVWYGAAIWFLICALVIRVFHTSVRYLIGVSAT